MATKVDEEAGVNGAGGTIKEEKIPLLKAQEFLDIENKNLYTSQALSPIFTNGLHLRSFTDFDRDLNGTVCYGLATTSGF
ncbi:hypothetical protein IGI04_007622 [Brassica rapa subsp. trilocularis]|uniref:Uncharacterized protein n=1 Tax=Brassica rapa subsp. trilocularis TaxID=1813537 RepID=A0ABQ7NK92_BRACM|nr:hypothetical protein IGI04_007622 [Brassica rapa subsp. trilocularis]